MLRHDNFIKFARSEGRLAKHSDKDGQPSELLFAPDQFGRVLSAQRLEVSRPLT